MPYKLISLVFLLFIFITNKAYSENEFLFPAKKPSIFKKIETKITQNRNQNLPQSKPIIKVPKVDKAIKPVNKETKNENCMERVWIKRNFIL